MTNPLPIASNSDGQLCLLPQLANRHGCITGATGTGKTVTLQVLAQALSDIGVPVFMADVKGDLSGLGKAGAASPKVKERLAHLGLAEPAWAAAPVAFWDVYGEKGHPVRATISDMGPLMLARMLNLNDTQQGVLQLVFKIADDNGLLLLDTKDLRAMLQHVGEHAAEFKTEYGNISAASIGAIQRGLIAIDEQGGDKFFGEPMLNIEDWMQTDARGKGVINILSADKLMNAPRLYSTFLLWMLSELFEHLPEVGDLDKPKMAFFFDEAHLLFDEAPKPLLQKIEQVVRLIRSKGVGVYFVTQNPLDIPDTVLGQLGNRVQHALRAYTPRDQKAVTAAAETFRANPRLNTAQAITELGVGEALVSFLDEKGRPNVVERGYVLTPPSQIGPVSEDERRALMAASLVAGIYEQAIDRESAYERLKGRTVQQQPPAAPAQTQGTSQTQGAPQAPADDNAWGASAGRAQTPPAQGARPSGGMARQVPQPPQSQPQPQDQGGGLGDLLKDAAGGIFGNGGGSRRSDSPLQAMVKSAARSIGSQVGREIIRGVLGSLMKKR
ncbi:helicase HerA-like C-terminal domain-containing protein [Herbaspirillum robiniae]|uniref:helicase HerA-like C-terminal domain-containing protein n=1 Tax=Herbaspirillum robiniae TaxID=2014887 RepID=UPI003D76FE92